MSEQIPDIDRMVVAHPPIYMWRPDPGLSIDTKHESIHWDGRKVGRFMVLGLSRGRDGDAACFIQAGVRAFLLEADRPTLHAKRDVLRRLLAAVLLYKKIPATKEIPLVSRVSYRFVTAL